MGIWVSTSRASIFFRMLSACQSPASELAVYTRPLAKLIGQVPPRGARAGNPENPIKNKEVVGGFAPIRGADIHNEPLKERPFLVRHQVSCQADLHPKEAAQLVSVLLSHAGGETLVNRVQRHS